jgi:hypothetical protein
MRNHVWAGRFLTLIALFSALLLPIAGCTPEAQTDAARAVTFASPAYAQTTNSTGLTPSLQSAYGQVFCSSNIAGVASQAGLSATTPVLTLYNPKGSSVDLVLWKVGWVQPVAAAAAGLVWLTANTDPNAAAVTGTLTTTKVFNTRVGQTTSPTGQALLAATLPAAPTAGMLLGTMLTGAITTVPNTGCNWTELNGLVRIAPGGAVSVQTSTASGALGLAVTYVWSEEPSI